LHTIKLVDDNDHPEVKIADFLANIFRRATEGEFPEDIVELLNLIILEKANPYHWNDNVEFIDNNIPQKSISAVKLLFETN
jgi:hypothetical protein